MSNFKSDKDPLREILRKIKQGAIQLPIFQRGWIWPDDHVQKIIASVSQSFPIGAILMLENGGPVHLGTRPIEGVKLENGKVNPETLILDGQQRLTALFQSVTSDQAVYTLDTKENKTHRWYYLDMKACVTAGTDRVESVISVPEDRIVKKFQEKAQLDLSSSEKEYAADMFPVNQIFNANQWERGYLEFWKDQAGAYDEKWDLFKDFDNKVIDLFKTYQVPTITLDKETSKEEVCLIFERVNSQGIELTVFELLTAFFAASSTDDDSNTDGFDLRNDWEVRNERMKEKYPILGGITKVNFLQALTLLTAGGCRRKEMLDLTAAKYQELADQVETGFEKAARFLDEQHILTARDLPYPPQLVPLAAILTKLGKAAETEEAQQKIARWFWCGVFGEMYGSATETRFANDFSEVSRWIKGEESNEPRTIRDANFQANRILDLRDYNSAAYKGIFALLRQAHDFQTGDTIKEHILNDDKIEAHHIFPKAWCCENCQVSQDKFRSSRYNSVVNKTPLLRRTNRTIGGKAPSNYLDDIKAWSGQPMFDFDAGEFKTVTTETKLDSHLIPIDAFQANNFEKFFEKRKEALLKEIEAVMGKLVNREEEDSSGEV